MHNPEHPVYIISKGRADSMITSKSLSRMKVPHYIIIEPQDEMLYEKALDTFNIRPWVTLIVAPFSKSWRWSWSCKKLCMGSFNIYWCRKTLGDG